MIRGVIVSIVLLLITGAAQAQAHDVFSPLEESAELTAVDERMIRFIHDSLQYPQMEKDNHIEGTVLVRFIMNEDGSVSDIKVVKKVSPGLDKEAVRQIKKLPRFMAGNVPVKATEYYLPVTFKLAR